MRQSPLLTFTSTRFVVEPGEDLETNPGVFGRSLAQWLSTSLHAAGHPAGEVFAEDFGWCFPIDTGPRRTTVACASDSDAPARWRVFVFAEGGLVGRMLGRNRGSESVEQVYSTIHNLLSAHPDIHGVTVEPSGRDDP